LPVKKTKRKVKKKWAQVQYFYSNNSESPEDFQQRINEWFQSLSKKQLLYSTEFDFFDPYCGVYFCRVILEEK
jgi:hypothetical protein